MQNITSPTNNTLPLAPGAYFINPADGLGYTLVSIGTGGDAHLYRTRGHGLKIAEVRVGRTALLTWERLA